MVPGVELDAVTLEIQWHRLITIMDEVDASIVRTSFSTIVGESRDFACILLDRLGRSLCQSQLSSPAFTVTLPSTTKHFLDRFPAETLRPGDVLITNDPWLASGHLPDLSICTPVFRRNRLAAFMGAVAHISDIGGRINYLEDQDLFEEGLRILPTFLFHEGKPVDLLFEMIGANSRASETVIGDIYAIVAAHAIGAQRLQAFLDDYELTDLDTLSEAILNRSERAMRSAIERLPKGTYSYEVYGDGVQKSLKVRTTVTIEGDEILVDFTGSSPEFAECSINCVYNDTFADTYYPLKCSLLPDLPNNEGIFRPVRVQAPEGCVFNTRFPRAVRARSKASFHIHAAIYGALAQAMPCKVQAGSGSFWSLTAFGIDGEGRCYRSHYLPNGGKGACVDMDGLPAIAFPYNGTATPAEILENTAPILVLCRELIEDSGGAGRWRGGLGQRVAIAARDSKDSRVVNVFVRPDKLHHPPNGLQGGYPGRRGSLHVNGVDMSFDAVQLGTEDLLELQLPGGGGVGDPLERLAALVAQDVQEGYVSRSLAQDCYGVILDGDGNVLAEETEAIRCAQRHHTMENSQ